MKKQKTDCMKIADKNFQPFFTTKSTGQGTGMGLSLSYDIIKAYEGELKVETKEGVVWCLLFKRRLNKILYSYD
jgi:C4-dicarboxylate-specific signal transduction histidine kinase